MSTLDQLIDQAVRDTFTSPVVPQGTTIDRRIEDESRIIGRAGEFGDDEVSGFRDFVKAQGGSLKGKDDQAVRYLMAERDLFPGGRVSSFENAEEVRDTRIYGGNPRGLPEKAVYGLSRITEATGVNDYYRGLRQGGIVTPARGVAGAGATVLRMFGSEEEAALYDQVAEDLRTRHDGGRGIAGLAGNAVGSALPTAAGLLGGGASLPMLYYGVTAYGNAGQDYRKAMDERGLDAKLQDEIVHGAGAAAIEVVTERLGLGYLGGLGRRGVSSIGDSILKGQFKQAAAQIAIASGEAAAVNAAEEVLAQVANNARERYGVPGLAGEVDPEQSLTEGVGEAAAGGGIVGALLGGGVRVSQDGGAVNTPVNDGEPTGGDTGDGDTSPAEGVENAETDSDSEPVNTPSVTVNDGATREALGEDVARFFRANGTEGEVVGPETDQQREIQQRAAERGLNVQFVRGKERLGRPAANPSPGVILLDADASPGRQTDALLWHEMVHEVERRDPEAWADLNAALSEIAPDLMDDAQTRYQEGWKAATGEDVSPEILQREGPSVAAELVIDAIVNEDASPGSLSRALSERPGIKDRIISVFQSLMNRLGLRRGLTLLEQAQKEQDSTRSALLIRDAVRTLKPYAPGTATSVDSGAVQAAPETQVQDAVDEPAVSWPRKRRPGEYSKRDIRRRLRAVAEEYGFSTGEGLVLNESERAEIADEQPDFSFGSDQIPGELAEALADQPPVVRQLFQTNQKNAHGEETLLTLGVDEMVRRARTVALRGDQGVGEFVRSDLGGEPIADVLTLLDETYGNLRREVQPQIEVQENPEQLPDGATFEIAGDEFVVYTDEQRGKRFTNGSRDLSLQVPEIPMDANTLSRNAGAAREDVEIDIPFAVQGDGQQDLPNAEAAETFVPQGRPDLANPGERPDARQFVNTVDELRNIAGEPVRMSDDEVERRADRMLATNESTIEQALKDKVDRGGLLDDVETVVAQRLVNRRALEAVAKKDRASYKAALQLTETYRQSGTLAARAFRQRRDQLKGPAERYRESLMRAFLEPDLAVRERMKRIREQLQDDTVSDRRKRKLRAEQDNLFNRESRKVAKIKEDLEKQGYDPRLLTEEAMQDPRTAASVIDIARRARTNLSDGLYWVWMNSILSGPQTHAANIVGNAVNFGWRFGGLKGVEAVAGSLQKRFGGDPDFTTRDYLHMWRMMGPAIADGYTNMVRSFQTNRQIFDEQITGERDQGYRFKGEAVRVPDSGPRNRALRAAGLGGLPLKLLTAEDQFFKTIAGTLEAHALAHRQAVREGLKGEARSERITELLQPRRGMFNEEYYDTDIWSQAYEDALTAVFQDDPSRIGKAAMELREGSLGFLLKWFIPFVRTPDRLFVRGIETSPLGAARSLTALAKASGKVEGETTATQDVAVALGALGLLAAMMAWKDDEDGFPRITGSRVSDYKLSGEQYRTAPPYSIRIGDNWYSYARIEPLSTGMALTIDLLDKLEDGDTPSDAALGSLDTLIGLTQDKTFVRSIGQLVEVFASPFTGGEGAGENMIELLSDTFITGWVPNVAKQTIRAADPGIVDNRAPSNAPFWEKQAAELPYKSIPLSDLAPVPRHDIWGRPIERGDPFGNEVAGFLWRLAVPVKVSPNDLHPMDLLIYNYNEKVRRNEIDNALDVDGADSEGEIHAKPPARYFTRRGERIDLTAQEYQDMIRNAGQRASERLLSMNLNVEDPGPRDAQRIKQVFSREYSRERDRIYRERRSRDQ
ncbi:MAG: hypothetical protein ACX94C_07745 [Phycisphaerales bacterium]